MTNESSKIKIAKILLKIKAVTLNPDKPYRFVSGILSPIYVDNRLLISYPKEREAVKSEFVRLIKKLKYVPDVIAGTATAGIPHAAWIAGKLKLPMVYIRSQAKDHGKGKQIEGLIKPGDKVILIEDMVSTGESSLSAIEAIKSAGGKIKHCLAIYTHNLPKSEASYKNSQVLLLTLTDFKTVVNIGVKEGYISKKAKSSVYEWNSNPQNWGKKMGFV